MIRKAAESAKQLLKELKIISPPINIRGIIKSLNIIVSEASHDDDGMSGLILKGKEGKVLIGVNESHSENRKRFTLAHELGHFKLHTKGVFVDEEKNFFIEYRTKANVFSVKESEANSFAAELLMPETLIKNDFQTLSENFENLSNEELINILSSKYEVSYEAMKIRLNNLLLILRN